MPSPTSYSSGSSVRVETASGRRGRNRRVPVELVGVTGGKCVECGLLIGTRTYIYNQ